MNPDQRNQAMSKLYSRNDNEQSLEKLLREALDAAEYWQRKAILLEEDNDKLRRGV